MADMYGSHFEFGGVNSRQYGLIIVNANTDRMVRLEGSKEGVTIFSKAANRSYLIDDDYSSSRISFDIEIMTDSDRTLELFERRTIEKWLFRDHGYRKLYLDIADDGFGETYEYIDGIQKRNYLNCRLINPEKIEGNGGIVGYKATLEADSNMYWVDPVVSRYSVDNGEEDAVSTITVVIDTDTVEYVYPRVTIKVGSTGGDIIISNNSDDSTRLTKFVNMSPESSVTMKGEINYVSDQYYQKFAYRNFIRLLDGENRLTIHGDVEYVEFEYSVKRVM